MNEMVVVVALFVEFLERIGMKILARYQTC